MYGASSGRTAAGKGDKNDGAKETHEEFHSLPVQKLSRSRGQGTIRGIHDRVDTLTVCISQHSIHVPTKRKEEHVDADTVLSQNWG
jgi:hypothetical protein